MAEQKSSEQLNAECIDLKRALCELNAWSVLRRRALKEYEEYIQYTLATGKQTCQREAEFKKKYLTDRMVAAISLDCNMLKRSILFMESREQRIRKRLAEIISIQSSADSAPSSDKTEDKSA